MRYLWLPRFALLLLASAPLLLAGLACGDDAFPTDGGSSPPGQGEIRVFAASSLTEAFTAASEKFRETHPGTRFVFNFGSSSALATQITEGAPADLFAAASPLQIASIGQNAADGETKIFATNALAVAVPAGSKLSEYRQLATPGLKLVLAARSVPAGQYARESLAKASTASSYGADFQQQVLANLKSEEVNVRAAIAKVQLGEADAAIVYVTDIAAGTGLRSIGITEGYNVVAEYPLTILKDAKSRSVARAFAAFLLSGEGQAVLAQFGFGRAP